MLDIEPHDLVGIEAQRYVLVEAALFGDGGKRDVRGIERFHQAAGHEESLAEHSVHGCEAGDIPFLRGQLDGVLSKLHVVVGRRGRRQNPTIRTDEDWFVHLVGSPCEADGLFRVRLHFIGRHALPPGETQNLTTGKGAETVDML